MSNLVANAIKEVLGKVVEQVIAECIASYMANSVKHNDVLQYSDTAGDRYMGYNRYSMFARSDRTHTHSVEN